MDDSVHLPAAAYALDALERDEVAAVRVAPRRLRALQRRRAPFAETAARLGAADQVAPSARTKDAVLSEHRQHAAASRSRRARRAGRRTHAARRPRRSAPLLLAAAAVLLAVVAASLGRAARARAQPGVGCRRTCPGAVAAVVAASDAQTSRGAVPGGGGPRSSCPRRQEAAVFLADGLAQPAPDHVYELWFIDAAGAARPAGTFVPGADGTAAQRMDGSPTGCRPGRPDRRARTPARRSRRPSRWSPSPWPADRQLSMFAMTCLMRV